MLAEIFKEAEEVRQDELDEIKKVSNIVNDFDDKANGYHAYAIIVFDREQADRLVNTLNRKYDDSWFLGDEDEEYVDVD